jgi:fructoselysine 6-kinase
VTTAAVLLGPISVDRYLTERLVLPGGGALNMAYHWASLGVPFHFVTRIGDDEAPVILPFLRRHGIECSSELVVDGGVTASIDIEIRADRQPWMDNFVAGVWHELTLSEHEQAVIAEATALHAVLVDPIVAELDRLGRQGSLPRHATSGDFLDFRHFTLDRFAATMRHLNLGFVGWPGAIDDPTVTAIRTVAFDLETVVVVTMGSQPTLVFDGARGETHSVPVQARTVTGTTVGCGDAFIAAFLASWWADGDLARAVANGQASGANATAWLRPLPDEAYRS